METMKISPEKSQEETDMETLNLRPFVESDWYGYGGAESPEGCEPLIGSLRCNGEDADVVVDKNGIGIVTGEEEYFLAANFRLGRHVASQLPKELSGMFLRSIGFEVR